MSDMESRNHRRSGTEFVRISRDEREREIALREQFVNFWGTASGEPRAIYDAFISASPLTNDVVREAVNEGGVRGWWVRPERAEPGQAILFLHGGGYVLGSAQRLSRLRQSDRQPHADPGARHRLSIGAGGDASGGSGRSAGGVAVAGRSRIRADCDRRRFRGRRPDARDAGGVDQEAPWPDANRRRCLLAVGRSDLQRSHR